MLALLLGSIPSTAVNSIVYTRPGCKTTTLPSQGTTSPMHTEFFPRQATQYLANNAI